MGRKVAHTSTSAADPRRRRELAQIHLGKKQLALDDETYRTLLQTVRGVESAGDLDAAGRQAVIRHLKSRGFRVRPSKAAHPGRPNNMDDADRGPMLRKVEAILTDARRPWAYAHAVAARMFGVNLVGWCTPDQLHKLIAALMKDQDRRRERPAASHPTT